jgi:hypothetical protein
MSWFFEGAIIDEINPQYCGFIYIIKNKTNNKQYVGKKLLKFKKTKIIKGKKKRFYVDSDWREYFGSSEYLKEDVKLLGEDNFHREIIRFCKSKGELSYYEAKLQMDLDVLLYPDKYYNEWIMLKTRRSHLLTKKLLSEQNEV